MSHALTDGRGCAVTGADPAALEACERALAAFQSWRGGAEAQLEAALCQAPQFVMAHVMRAYLALCSRDPRQVRSAGPLLQRAAALRSNAREQLHLSAIGAVLADDFVAAKNALGELLRRHPRDVLGLQVAHSLDYVTGDAEGMRVRVASVLPAWSRELPGYHAVLSMHAFSMAECGNYPGAEQAAREALDINPGDARANHAMAHVFEMSERPAEGVRWMREHMARWSIDTVAATHCWWHLGLFHLEHGDIDGALSLYDERVRASRSGEIADLIDAAALLWRIRLQGADPGPRWAEIAAAWEAYIDDAYCSFSDVHAMLAFVGAGDLGRARRLEAALAARQSQATRYGLSTRRLGLPACRALMAFDSGDDATAVPLLASLSPFVGGLGGSHAQRDVLHLTLLHSVERLRRPSPHRQHLRRVNRAQAPALHAAALLHPPHPAAHAVHAREGETRGLAALLRPRLDRKAAATGTVPQPRIAQ